MKAATVITDYSISPEHFTLQEIDMAQQKGVVLKFQFSHTQQRTYLASTCPSCDAFLGQGYEHEVFCDYEVQREEFDLGLECGRCREAEIG